MRKEFHKIFLVLLAPVVMGVLYYSGMRRPSTVPKPTAEVPREKITGITITNKPTGPTLADLPEGVEGCGPVWFTESGEAFVWPWVEQRNGILDECNWKVKHVNGVWYGRLVGRFDDGTITGYRDLRTAITLSDGSVDGAPIILDKHYTYVKDK